MEAIFKLNGRIAETRKWAAGPWNAAHQHGSAPSSLIAYAVEQLPAPQPMRVARLTIDLMRPVPIAPLEIRTEVLREGRKIQLIAVTLLADDVPVVRATVLKIRDLTVDLPDNIQSEPVTVPLPREGMADANTNASNPFL